MTLQLQIPAGDDLVLVGFAEHLPEVAGPICPTEPDRSRDVLESLEHEAGQLQDVSRKPLRVGGHRQVFIAFQPIEQPPAAFVVNEGVPLVADIAEAVIDVCDLVKGFRQVQLPEILPDAGPVRLWVAPPFVDRREQPLFPRAVPSPGRSGRGPCLLGGPDRH